MSTARFDDRFGPLVRFMENGIPFNAHLGLRVDAIGPGRCVLRLPWRDAFTGDPFRPAVHGGVISTLVDTAGGAACFSLLENPNDRVSTVDLRVDYLRPARLEDLVCVARVVRMGNRVAVARMEVFNGDPPDAAEADRAGADPVATGQGVYNVLRTGDP